jgi:arylsulfatase A-like enzyme
VFGVFGLVDGALSLAGPSGALGARLQAGVAAVGLWLLAGLIAGVATAGLLRLVIGSNGPSRVVTAGRRTVQRVRAEAGSEGDRRRLATLCGFALAALLFVALSAVGLVYLQEHRHGAELIAVTFIVAQAAFATIAAAAGRVLFRAVRAGLNGVAARWPRAIPSTFAVVAVSLALGLLGLLGAAMVYSETFEALDGLSLTLPALALLAQPLGTRLVRERPQRPWALAVVGAVALALVIVPMQSEANRSALVSDGHTAKYLLAALQRLSDFDRDGSPSFPASLDCAPLDPARHPFALEIGGNGIDENCDGSDEAPAAQHRPAMPTERLAVSAADRPNLILITLDATRADHLGFMGYGRDISPNLDALAGRSVVFTQAFSQDSGTGPSMWSLMAGKTPFQVELVDTGHFPPQFGDGETLLAEALGRRGYRTSAVLCGSMFRTKQWKIDRGFDSFKEVCGALPSRHAELVSERALTELMALRRQKEPFFLWIHYLDPHGPYFDHPDQNLGPEKVDLYDEEIAYLDGALGPTLRELMRPGQRQMVLAITADHGENFAEHGADPHARTLYREVTHVPLIIYETGVTPRRVDAPVALGDIHPTFLEFAGATWEHATMVSQAPVVRGGVADPDRLVFQENSYSRPVRHAKGVVGRGYHMIMDTTNDVTELYDLRADPAEKTNLFGKGLPVEPGLVSALKAFVPDTRQPAPEPSVTAARERAAKAKADKAKADKAKADKAKADKAKADKAKADKAKADQDKADGAKADGAKADKAKADKDKADGAKADGAKADGAKADGAKADGGKADQDKAGQDKAGQDKAGQAKAGQAKAGQAKAEGKADEAAPAKGKADESKAAPSKEPPSAAAPARTATTK